MEIIIKFYDTCSLLLAGESAFENDEKFIISSITLKELERIKTAANKDSDVKYSARLLLHLFEKYPNNYSVKIHQINYEYILDKMNFDINDDARILSDAWNEFETNKCLEFITNDLSLKHIALCLFPKENVSSIEEDLDTYSGIAEITADEELISEFYENPNYNHFNLKKGEYLLLKSPDNFNELIDVRVWTGETYRYLKFPTFDSTWFGKVQPYQGDIYQKCAFDSLANNKITLLQGPAGVGKSYISLAFLMYMLERNRIDKIIIFCNTVATINSAKLGFYPGTKDDKLLDSQIGNMLSAKLGGKEGVLRMMEEGKLILLPFSDIRGYDTSGMNAGIYITEAQNLDRTLIKLALQRIGEDCICIIDGDAKTQVDSLAYSGNNNGMRRMSKIFRGSDIYGEVTLNNIHRSKIAELAELI